MKYVAIHLRKQTQYDETVQDCSGSGGWYSINVYTGRLRPEVQPLILLCAIFHVKDTPFVYLLLTNGTPSHTLFRTLRPF